MRFSQRIGKTEVRSALQVNTLDDHLRNRIWNAILELKAGTDQYDPYSESTFQQLSRVIWEDFFKYPMDRLPVWNSNSVERVDSDEMISTLRKWFFKAEWFEVYDFIEFISSYNLHYSDTTIHESFNYALKKEMSGYRIVNASIVQITSEEEIAEIENAIIGTDQWKSVNTHLTTALTFLSDRKNPNYRNSIKESISAVEALCKIITGNQSTTLGEALNSIEKKHFLHPALKKSFSSLYGYTSDSSGIRHALLETDRGIELEDAKFMLISCSAFINFLKAKYIS
jgi:hypothetical protein